MGYSKCNELGKCRVCKLSNVKRNYHRHLIDKHPETDPNDLSVYGQLKLNFQFWPKKEICRRTPTSRRGSYLKPCPAD